MIRSMTGYGRCEQTLHGRSIAVEIRSVNHRYFEFSSRTARGYGFLDEKLKAYLQDRISRGKVEVSVAIDLSEDTGAAVQLNHSLALGYIEAMRELSEKYGIPNDMTVSTLSRCPDLFTVHKAPEDEDVIWEDVRRTTEEALARFVAMREIEGAKLREDVENRGKEILRIVSEIEERSPETVKAYENRLRAKIEETLGDRSVDEQRLLTEVAIFADKVAVAEETVRLRSHFTQFFSMLEEGGAIGRKLDFLVQEMNREANTIGSKATDAQCAHRVVDIKAEIEKIREQIQNIE